jgi:hypothetical protein
MADESDSNSNESKPAPEPAAKRRAPKKKKGKKRRSSSGEAKPKRAFRSYRSISLEKALQVAYEIREKNGGNPWATDQVAAALWLSPKGIDFYSITAAARDYGLANDRDAGDEGSLSHRVGA